MTEDVRVLVPELVVVLVRVFDAVTDGVLEGSQDPV